VIVTDTGDRTPALLRHEQRLETKALTCVAMATSVVVVPTTGPAVASTLMTKAAQRQQSDAQHLQQLLTI